ncbi:MAG: hypothetical protein JRI22_09995 [Deltaproteobacteria bacterium]|nr:hypothetical protein [Deltaproteobacteria bacterium]
MISTVGKQMTVAILVVLMAPGFSQGIDVSLGPDLSLHLGGFLKDTISISHPMDAWSELGIDHSDTFRDNQSLVRLEAELFRGRAASLKFHYELFWAVGDTQRSSRALRDALDSKLQPFFGADSISLLAQPGIIPDDPPDRLLDLTSVIHEDDNQVLVHRLDRLVLTLFPSWGTVSVGRQAVTWGNGFLFNPMDLLNPFPPTTIDRDVKPGTDLISVEALLGGLGSIQTVVVPRQDLERESLDADRSSFAARFHTHKGETEFDLMGAHHFQDNVVGVGVIGYLGGAAWRVNATWTHLNTKVSGEKDYPSLVANIDYAFTWRVNFYTFVEYFHNGIGTRRKEEYARLLTLPSVRDRLARGEIFNVGKNYGSWFIRAELHPLLNLDLTTLINLDDGSGIAQPRLVWNAVSNLFVTAGVNWAWGSRGTEFGGIEIPGTDSTPATPDQVFVFAKYYF